MQILQIVTWEACSRQSILQGKGKIDWEYPKATHKCCSLCHQNEKQGIRHTAARLLKHDLLNGPLHYFGYHDQRSSNFCSTAHKNQLTDPSLLILIPLWIVLVMVKWFMMSSSSAIPPEDIVGTYFLKSGCKQIFVIIIHNLQKKKKKKNMYMYMQF